MSFYCIEQWSLRDVAQAFRSDIGDSNNRKVVIPIFQRGLRWEDARREQFIESLNKGYPFGSLLFAKQTEPNTYSVVDGLQRGSTICDYVFNPLSKNNISKIDEDVLTKIRVSLFPGNLNITIKAKIQEIILSYFHDKKTFDQIENYDLAKRIIEEIQTQEEKFNCCNKIIDALKPFVIEQKRTYEKICSVNVPIIIYSGPNELLSEIFNRINVKGIPLNNYEIYAAIWSQKKKTVNTAEIVNKVVDKYLTLAQKGYNVDGFDANEMLKNKELTAFEYLFGLGRYWSDKFECLKFSTDKRQDTVNEIGFEIIDACINDSKKISDLDKSLYSLNINKLQKKIEEAILFVQNAIATVSSFKGNKRKFNILHSKYQIVSLVSYIFRQMYNLEDLNKYKISWAQKKETFQKNILSHYVADIISNEWHEGGGNKVYTAIKENRYSEEISKDRWASLLDNYYQNQLANKQSERFSNPTNADSVILNCIYSNIFTANDQLSSKKFDIEHLATKEKMKKLIKKFDGLRLPIACIANLCYLPEDVNRGKREKTIYEVHNMSLPLHEIESKFSFTKQSDLDWIFIEYSDPESLQSNYYKYLYSRYLILKTKFLNAFGY